MKPDELISWRGTMNMSKRRAAAALGMTDNAYRAMEAGQTVISKRTALACAALYLGADKIAQPWLGH